MSGSPQDQDDIEQEEEANEFAMELLMPENWIRRDTEGMPLTDKHMKPLAKQYGVDVSLLAYRIAQIRGRRG